MFKVEVTYGSDPMAQAALNRRVHDRLTEEVFNGRNLDVLDEILHPDFVNHHELFPTKARKGPGVYRELYVDFFRAFPEVQSVEGLQGENGPRIKPRDLLQHD